MSSLAKQQIADAPGDSNNLSMDEVFNDDLLMSPRALSHAKAQFPELIHVLDHPRLRETFEKYEKLANHARDMVRRWGFATIFLATLSLFAVVTQPIWHHAAWTRWPAFIVELGGMGAALIAARVMVFGPWKTQWLQSRLMTERLRQWHFQILVRRISDVVESCKDADAIKRFQEMRERWFDEFLIEHEGHLPGELQSLANEPGLQVAWLHSLTKPCPKESPIFPILFEAYKRLRFLPQIRYARWKLREDRKEPLWQFLEWPAICQRELLTGISAFSFALAIICSAFLAYGHAFGIPEKLELYVSTGAIGAALIGAALRTVQDGLALEKGIERYQDYLYSVSQLNDRFGEVEISTEERLEILEEMEIVSVEEMKQFLRAHYHATFLLG